MSLADLEWSFGSLVGEDNSEIRKTRTFPMSDGGHDSLHLKKIFSKHEFTTVRNESPIDIFSSYFRKIVNTESHFSAATAVWENQARSQLSHTYSNCCHDSLRFHEECINWCTVPHNATVLIKPNDYFLEEFKLPEQNSTFFSFEFEEIMSFPLSILAAVIPSKGSKWRSTNNLV